ncbi:MAG TPA: GNAT family N-acetyltransferase [Gaiellaceae bacterium]|nr:GNAT family N-acetyltransferase [Gaiellaceae bacterium]
MSWADRIETERLLLRRPVHADLGDLHRIHADPRSWVHKPELRHADRAESGRRLAEWLAHWEARGYGYWTIAREERIVGFGGLMLMPDWNGRGDVLNLYYRIEPESWGQGLATELARAAVDAAGRELATLTVVARIRPTNVESMRVAERAGLVRRDDLDDAEFLVYGTPAA